MRVETHRLGIDGNARAEIEAFRQIDGSATREHGGTRIGRMIRSIVADPENTDLDDIAEALLIAADRAQHLRELVGPALAGGRHVVSDRSVHSALGNSARMSSNRSISNSRRLDRGNLAIPYATSCR